MDLIDPFTTTVVTFGLPEPRDTVSKAARHSNGHFAVVWPPPGAKTLRALLPTGRNFGHGQRLTQIKRGARGKQSPGLEHYSKAYGGGALLGQIKQAEQQAVRGKQLAGAVRKPASTANRFQSPGRHGRKIYNITP